MKSTTTTITRPSDKHREFTELETALETVTRLRRNLRDLEEKKSKAVLHAIRNDGINPGADMIPIVGPLDSRIDATQEELDGVLSEIDRKVAQAQKLVIEKTQAVEIARAKISSEALSKFKKSAAELFEG